jgi:SAM-dependent methyltransferase
MSVLKTALLNLVRRMGYRLERLPRPADDLPLYHRLYSLESVSLRRFYNVGAGDFFHPAWTNVDNPSEYYADSQGDRIAVSWDLMKLGPIPLDDGVAEIVYTSHTVEHITDAAAQNFFREAHRVLKPAGVLRITCPDIDLAHRAWRENDRAFFDWYDLVYSNPDEMRRINLALPMREASLAQIFLYQFASAASLLHGDGAARKIGDEELARLFETQSYEQALDACVDRCPSDIQARYPYNHINWWNRDKAIRLLSAAGFSRAYPSGYGQSAAPVMRNTALFDSTHPKWSLYVEARK